MFSRARLATLIVAAAGTPYFASETEMGRNTVNQLFGLIAPDNLMGSTRTDYSNHAHHQVESLRTVSTDRFRYEPEIAAKLGAIPADPAATPSLVGTQVHDLRDVVRFDINPFWVTQRFSRVSTVLADLQLEGLRVPLVTGTGADALAGTLTYYFDGTGAVQRIMIHGFTGDPRTLAQMMTEHYGLQPEGALEAGVMTRRWNGQPVHFYRISYAPVVYSDAVHQKYTVFLELNQPNLGYGISDEAKRIIQSDRSTGRW
jgi:hypothetical protein